MIRADIERLEAAIAAKKAAVADAKKREAALREQERLDRQRHDETVSRLQAEARAIEGDMMRMRDDHAAEIMKIRQDAEDAQNAEREKIAAEVRKEYEPRIQELKQRTKELREKRDALENSMKLEAANRSVVDQAILAATMKISKRIEEEFEKRFGADKEWEEQLNASVKSALEASFLPQIKADEEAERAEQKRAFEQLLAFWRDAEDEERKQLARNDELLLTEIQSLAHRDLDALQNEERALQQAFVEAREEWAVAHRKALDNEADLAVERRKAEFEELRRMQQAVHAQRIAELERAHHEEMERIQAAHDEEVRLAKAAHAEREALQQERVDLYRRMQEEVDKATQSMAATASEINTSIARVDAYRKAVEQREAEIEKERQEDLEAREAALKDIEGMITEQATAIDAERRELSNAAAQLSVAQKNMQRQAEEQKVWAAQMTAKLERARQEWEREYRRWQHISEQERRAAEQRFSGLALELRHALKALDEESEQLQADMAALKRRGEERSERLAQETHQLEERREEMRQRYNDVAQIVADLEGKARVMSDEWQRLHLERQDLHYQRQQVEAEEQRLRETEQQVGAMRDAVRTSQRETAAAEERARAAHKSAAVQRAMAESELAAARQQQSQLAAAKENLRVERAKTAAQVQQRVATATQRQRAQAHVGGPGGLDSRGPSMAQRLLQEMRQELHADPAASRGSDFHSRAYAPGSSSQGSGDAGNVRSPNRSGGAAVPAGTSSSSVSGFESRPAAAGVPGPANGASVSQIDVSRSTRMGPEATHATSHWTALERLSDLETTSGSRR